MNKFNRSPVRQKSASITFGLLIVAGIANSLVAGELPANEQSRISMVHASLRFINVSPDPALSGAGQAVGNVGKEPVVILLHELHYLGPLLDQMKVSEESRSLVQAMTLKTKACPPRWLSGSGRMASLEANDDHYPPNWKQVRLMIVAFNGFVKNASQGIEETDINRLGRFFDEGLHIGGYGIAMAGGLYHSETHLQGITQSRNLLPVYSSPNGIYIVQKDQPH